MLIGEKHCGHCGVLIPEHNVILLPAVSNQIPLILSLKKGLIKCISACLSTSNCIVKIITEIAICNPMSCSGDNYRELLDGQGTLNLEPSLLSWKYNLTNLRNDMYTYKELLDMFYVCFLMFFFF